MPPLNRPVEEVRPSADRQNPVRLSPVTTFFDAHSHLPEADARHPDYFRVVCGTCESDWEAVLAHAASDERVIPMLGLHPWFVAEASPEWAPRLESLLRSHPAGVGECGLDFAGKGADRSAQEAAFRLQLRLAHGLHRPIALHGVRAWGRLVALLREEGVPPAAMVHAFSGSPETKGFALFGLTLPVPAARAASNP